MQPKTKVSSCLRTLNLQSLSNPSSTTALFGCQTRTTWKGRSYNIPHLPLLKSLNCIPKESVVTLDSTTRDGLQKRKEIISTEDKLALIEAISEAGYPHIEFGSLVKNLESMANTEAVFKGLNSRKGEIFDILIPNEKGLERLIPLHESRKDLPLRVSLITTASAGFALKNTNCSVQTSLERTGSLIKRLASLNLPNRVYLSFAYGGFQDEELTVDEIASFSQKLFDMGAQEVVLSDTNGKASAKRVYETIQAIRERSRNPKEAVKKLGHHFHGDDLERVAAALEQGARKFDTTINGIGGCPSIANTEGNLNAKHLLTFLEKSNFRTGIDIEKVSKVEFLLAKILKEKASSI